MRGAVVVFDVSIHAFREGRRRFFAGLWRSPGLFQSTPSAREGDRAGTANCSPCRQFQSTPSAREGDKAHFSPPFGKKVSIHAFREGRRRGVKCWLRNSRTVSIHAFREGRRLQSIPFPPAAHAFQSTPSAREGDRRIYAITIKITRFNPRLPRGKATASNARS